MRSHQCIQITHIGWGGETTDLGNYKINWDCSYCIRMYEVGISIYTDKYTNYSHWMLGKSSIYNSYKLYCKLGNVIYSIDGS